MKSIILLFSATILFFSCKNSTEKNEKTSIKTAENTTTSATKGFKIGDEAIDFSLKNVDGKMVSLKDYPEAKGYIVIFTCNHCPYSKAYEDRIIALNNAFAAKGYPVIAINPNDPEAQPDDSYEKMQIRAKEKGFNFPYLLDEGQQIYPVYGANKTPHVFVLNKENNKNIVRYIGAIDNNYEDETQVTEHFVEDAVNALLENKSITTATTKAIGCSIKVKE